MHSGAAKNRLRVVLDSNVLVSAFVFLGGVPYWILQRLLLGEILVGVSPFILSEVGKVLKDKFHVSEETTRIALNILKERCTLVDPPATAANPDLSPADNRILDCAISMEVDHPVTGDKGIQRLGEFQGIRIISPTEFLGVVFRDRSES
jgi:putative PIN family toxin of toxin-antitoxin system